jgi:hypothetical protein
MAELEERIARWRRNLAESLGGTAETLEELEDHLRDDVEAAVAAGQPLDVAFAAAVERLGPPGELAAELARSAPASPWPPVRVAMVVLIAGAGWVAGMLMPRLADPLLAVHILAVTVGYSITLLIGALAVCYLLARPFGALPAAQLQGLVRATRQLTIAALILTGVGVILGSVWAQDKLGRFWTWDPREMGGACVILWNVAMVAILGRRLLSDHAALLLGLAGNVVVALAWFGPHLLGVGLHAYGLPGAVSLGVFVLANGLLAGLGVVPAGVLRRAS